MRRSWPMSIEMRSLLELQLQLRRVVLGGDTTELVGAIRGDGLDPAGRLRIYRNHALTTLGAVLEGTFPVVCRLVDKRFFLRTPRMNTWANTRRIRVALSNTAPTLPISSPPLSRVRICPIWRTSRASNGPSTPPRRRGRRFR